MKAFATATGLSALATMAAASSAPVVTNNPLGASYYAQIPPAQIPPATVYGAPRGTVAMVANPAGVGMKLSLNIAGLPMSKGPYTYYIAENRLASTDDCSSAGGIFDPYHAGSGYCNPHLGQTCAVGDLSGKHGSINSTSFVASYNEVYASLNQNSPAFVGDKSIVISDRSGHPLVCANLLCTSPGSLYNGTAPYPTNGTGSRHWKTTPNPPIHPTAPPSSLPRNGAVSLAVSGGAVFAAVGALLSLA